MTHKEKCQSRMSVYLKKTEFAPAGVQAGSSSRIFHPEATGAGGQVQSKKLYQLKRKLLHLQSPFFLFHYTVSLSWFYITFTFCYIIKNITFVLIVFDSPPFSIWLIHLGYFCVRISTMDEKPPHLKISAIVTISFHLMFIICLLCLM